MKAGEITALTRGRLWRGRPGDRLGGICTDSRGLKPGQCFLALRGERFDGHDFLKQVVGRKASGLIVEAGRVGKNLPGKIPVIAVADTLAALGDLAAAWRRKFSLPVIAVTGSTGKSTTKEMIARILAGRYRVLRNEGNLNTLIGLPLTLLQLKPSHRAAVLEMGMNRPGEIARLTEIAAPDIGLITNVGPVHLEGLGSLAGVARAKGELARGLDPEAWAIVNLDDARARKLWARHRGPRIGFSRRPRDSRGFEETLHLAAFRPVMKNGRPGIEFALQLEKSGRPYGRPAEFNLETLAWHNVENVLAAAAVCRALGVPLPEAARRLRDFQGLKGRNQLLALPGGIKVVNDSYNANPVSMLSALRSFNYWRGKGRAFVVLGDMLELGRFAAAEHRRLGRALGEMGFERLVLRGEFSELTARAAIQAGVSKTKIKVMGSNREVVSLLRAELQPGDWVLVKASRKLRLDEVVEALHRGKR